jgi:hypothetical protein
LVTVFGQRMMAVRRGIFKDGIGSSGWWISASSDIIVVTLRSCWEIFSSRKSHDSDLGGLSLKSSVRLEGPGLAVTIFFQVSLPRTFEYRDGISDSYMSSEIVISSYRLKHFHTRLTFLAFRLVWGFVLGDDIVDETIIMRLKQL